MRYTIVAILPTIINGAYYMTTVNTSDVKRASSPLEQARELTLPSRKEMLERAPTVDRFWQNNSGLLQNAWQHWEASRDEKLPNLDEVLIDKSLREAINRAWVNPNKEGAVKDLWHEVAPGVYKAQFFDVEEIAKLRNYFDQASDAGIPLKPPYGIVLNRFGGMLDKRSTGYLAAPNFQAFYQMLHDKYMRPIARLLMPEVYGFDSQTFGFSIKYQAGVDTSLRLHTDASAATMNINMNLQGETYKGSQVDFYDSQSGRVNRLVFEPGTAMIHRGNVAHAAQAITEGERSNIVMWLYGKGMTIPHHQNGEDISPEQRWTVPNEAQDAYAPF